MNENLRMAFSIVVWCALVAYLVFAVRLCTREKEKTMLANVEIKVLGDETQRLVTPKTIEGWLGKQGYDFKNIGLHRVNTDEIRTLVEGYPFVKSAKVYTEINGQLNIEVTQRLPIARVTTSNGYNFYLSSDNWILPIQSGSATYIPIVTGSFSLPFPPSFSGSIEERDSEEQINNQKHYLYFLKLIKFVKTIDSDNFWRDQIVQINVRDVGGASWRDPEVELITRVGRQIVILGSLDEAEDKLGRLLTFYTKALNHEGWERYRTINLKYKDQVVAIPYATQGAN